MGVLRYRLTNIPQFDNLAILKAEDMNDSPAEVIRILFDMGVNYHGLFLLYSKFNLKYFMRILGCTLLHSEH